jgi:hypothetical protein
MARQDKARQDGHKTSPKKGKTTQDQTMQKQKKDKMRHKTRQERNWPQIRQNLSAEYLTVISMSSFACRKKQLQR